MSEREKEIKRRLEGWERIKRERRRPTPSHHEDIPSKDTKTDS